MLAVEKGIKDDLEFVYEIEHKKLCVIVDVEGTGKRDSPTLFHWVRTVKLVKDRSHFVNKGWAFEAIKMFAILRIENQKHKRTLARSTPWNPAGNDRQNAVNIKYQRRQTQMLRPSGALSVNHGRREVRPIARR